MNVEGIETMFSQIRQILETSRDTLLYDFAGVLALGAMTIGLLHLPGLA
jgi:hypothetical protein